MSKNDVKDFTSDLIQSLNGIDYEMCIQEQQTHLVNVLNAFAAFGNSPYSLLEGVVTSLSDTLLNESEVSRDRS